MVVAVNAAGVHLNACASNPHRTPLLSFVCGLGVVKAHDLVSRVKKLKHSQVPLLKRGMSKTHTPRLHPTTSRCAHAQEEAQTTRVDSTCKRA